MPTDLKHGWATGPIVSFLVTITLMRIVISTDAKGAKSHGDTLCNGVKFPARRGGRFAALFTRHWRRVTRSSFYVNSFSF